jgi:RNA polymerase sigma factor (sigma-70 family)
LEEHVTPYALIAPARLAGVPLLRAQSDERLVDLVRAGNDAAFEAIVARYRRPLLRYCSRFLSEARAEDAVQTTFVNAFDSLRSSSGDMKLRPWLYRIAHNTALNALRDRSLQHEQLPEQIDGVERPDQAYERNERLRDVVAAVGALPERQRDAMVQRELEGRSYEEIAANLGVSGGSVRQLLNRGRNTLRSGMTAVTPFGLLARVPWGAGPGESVAARVAEMCAGGAGAAVVTKVCATAIVTGAVVGGVASSPSGGIDDGGAKGNRADTQAEAASRDAPRGEPDPAGSLPFGAEQETELGRADEDGAGQDEGRREGNEGPGGGDDDRSGPSGDSRGRQGGDRSGSGHGGGDATRDDSSGPSTSGSSGSGGGEGSSGSGSSGSSRGSGGGKRAATP